MSVWFCIPSARPAEEAERVLKLWRERGYKIALFVDWNPPGVPLYSRKSRGDLMLCGGGQYAPKYDAKPTNGPLELRGPLDPGGRQYYPHFNEYPGYAQAVNALIVEVMKEDPQAEWFVTGGDDVEPDLNHTAEEIARQCSERFANLNWPARGTPLSRSSPTFGVMQPTGDRFAGGSIDRICGSPWMGREFCRRMYGGRGPFWPEYTHCFGDEEMFEVTKAMGVLWQRPDLIHLHRHFQRESDALDSDAVKRDIPEHLIEANSQAHWAKYKAIFTERKRLGFPGHQPIP